MNLRLALHALEATHGLDALAARRLRELSQLDAPPPALMRWLPLGLGALAAGLLGFGLVLWIAANWETLGRFGRFALLEGVIVVMGVGAIARAGASAALSLVVLLGTGALFAYFGQTYQTGADPWQLFVLWAALTLPLALGVRSDLLWAPWVLVSFVGIALGIRAFAGHRWEVGPDDLAVHLAGWGVGGLVVLAMCGPCRRWTGAGIWALRAALTLLVFLVSATGLAALFRVRVAPHYGLGLLVLGALAAGFAMRRGFDVYAVSFAALGVNGLVVAGLVRVLLWRSEGDWLGRLFLIGLVAAALLAASAQGIVRLARLRDGQGSLP